MKLGLSRFACLRRIGEELVADGLGGTVMLERSEVELVTGLATVRELDDAARDAGLTPEKAAALAKRLLEAGVLLDEADFAAESGDVWDFADLRFHAGTRPPPDREHWMRAWPPPPELPEPSGYEQVSLPRPDLDARERDDPPFARVLAERRSIREPGADPLTAAQLGEFLFRAGRVEDLAVVGEDFTYAPRPYPAAGGLYELELYVVVNDCEGIEQGIYHYRGDEHLLAKLADATADVRVLLADATAGMAAERPPSVLVIVGARFGRLSWKYGPLAYSLMLKNVGVVMQTMYLLATAMGLAPCAVGTGDSETFARATGLGRDDVTSVGEFCLSSAS